MKGLRLTKIFKKKKKKKKIGRGLGGNSNQKIFLQSIKQKTFETNSSFHVKIRNTGKV